MKGMNTDNCLPFQVAMGQPPDTVLVSGVVTATAIEHGGAEAVTHAVEMAARKLFKALSEKDDKPKDKE